MALYSCVRDCWSPHLVVLLGETGAAPGIGLQSCVRCCLHHTVSACQQAARDSAASQRAPAF